MQIGMMVYDLLSAFEREWRYAAVEGKNLYDRGYLCFAGG